MPAVAPLDTTPAPVRFLQDRFGGAFEDEDGTIDVATTATKIVDNNPETIELVMVNVGTENVYVRPGNKPSLTEGILLLASGGSLTLTVRDDAMLPSREWYGIADTAASKVYYVRIKRYYVSP